MSVVYPLGKLPPVEGAVKLHYSDYREPSANSLLAWLIWLLSVLRGGSGGGRRPKPRPTNNFPKVPTEFGLKTLPDEWKMQGNDSVGDCVEAGAIHETILWTLDGYGPDGVAHFDDDAGIALYSKWTGYSPDVVGSDRGSNVVDVAKIRVRKGFMDASGKVHRIGAFVGLKTGNLDELAEATYLFGCVGVGVRFPQQWMEAFHRGEPWDVVGFPKFVGGHYIPIIGRNAAGNFIAVSWGRLVEITPGGYQQCNDETLAYIAADYLGTDKVSPAGFKMKWLKKHLDELVGIA